MSPLPPVFIFSSSPLALTPPIVPIPPTLTLISLSPSQLQPQCLAKERLIQWLPLIMRSASFPLAPSDSQRIYDVIGHAWAESTKETYRSGLLVYHTFCDLKGIPEASRAPASHELISTFISNLAGTYTGSTVTNYLSAVHAWHTIHGLKWSFNSDEIDTLVKAAKTLAPASSKHSPREPYTIDTIIKIRSHLSLTDPLDAAVFACLTTTFFVTARTGEFTVKNLNSFNLDLHVTRNNMSIQRDHQGLEITNFHLSHTTAAPQGKMSTGQNKMVPLIPITLS